MTLPQPLGALRSRLRDVFFAWWKRALRTDEGKGAVVEALRGLLGGPPHVPERAWHREPPYADVGRAESSPRTSERDDVIFITARFRSGSTLLWNLFRHVPEFTAYYEPFNERRWFDPRSRGERVDATHLEVDDYWREYEGCEELSEWYDEDWTSRHLWMDGDFHAPKMQRYVERLIELARGRPVLQFNRIDFRLLWFRRRFPQARIVHLYRHPRDQWRSTLLDDASFPLDGKLSDFGRYDKFYLLAWLRDLKYQFPFLSDLDDCHPYRAFYLIWRLSWLWGTELADCSLAFEALVEDPRGALARLFEAVQISTDVERLLPLVRKPALGRWRSYADDEWFRRHESVAETTLADFFGSAAWASRPAEDSHSRDLK
jgi:hypothetical protein